VVAVVEQLTLTVLLVILAGLVAVGLLVVELAVLLVLLEALTYLTGLLVQQLPLLLPQLQEA
jgi:hypothetical protein